MSSQYAVRRSPLCRAEIEAVAREIGRRCSPADLAAGLRALGCVVEVDAHLPRGCRYVIFDDGLVLIRPDRHLSLLPTARRA